MHLHGLGGLVAEPLDEVLGVVDKFLLVLVGAHLLLHALLAQFHKLAVTHLVVIDFAQRDLDGAVGDIIDESAVVGHEQQGCVAVFQEGFQPLDGLDVQMVGRLIEQQHVRASQQQFGQLDTHAPAAAELAGGTVKVAALKTQSGQCLLDFGLDVLALHQGAQLGLLGNTFDEFLVVLAVIVGALGQVTVHAVDGLIHLL